MRAGAFSETDLYLVIPSRTEQMLMQVVPWLDVTEVSKQEFDGTQNVRACFRNTASIWHHLLATGVLVGVFWFCF